MNTLGFSRVEQTFFERSGRTKMTTRMPYIVVDNFPDLGLLTSLRFLEWVAQNPNGVISLPTGKTPEYFIKWTKYLLNYHLGALVDGLGCFPFGHEAYPS